MAKGEIHVQLYVNYADDEKLVSVSRSARLLYVDGLCLAKRQLNDGRLTLQQVEKLMYPERPANAKKAADELVKSGAWEWDDERRAYIISAWLKRNKSAEQVQREREAAEEAALLGNHRRWHEMRGGMDPRCRYCIGGESGTRSGGRSGGGQQDDSTETETETETEKEKPSSPPATDSPEFIRFWSAYPRRVGKGHARRAWNQATKKKGADPESIIAAAEAFAAQCKRNRTEQQYIPHPATWLNGERYADPEPTRTDEPRGWWDN